MQITEYSKAGKFDEGDVILKDGANGTKTMGAEDLLLAAVDAGDLIQMHRNIYRGKNLGSSLTTAQKAAIADQTFDDMFIGDYWLINGIHWRIADINYWLHDGDTEFTKPHLVIVPDENLGDTKMEDTNTTANGYYGSKMVQSYMQPMINKCISAFGDNILEHKVYLSNAAANGVRTAGAWYARKVDLMNENMVYGCPIFGSMSAKGDALAHNVKVEKSQLALFQLKPEAIVTLYSYWLQDVVGSAAFANVAGFGYASVHHASDSRGVRPAFPIGNPA